MLLWQLPSNVYYKGINYQRINVCRLILQLSLPNPLKPGVENEDAADATEFL